ncbi:NAD(P)-dependent oxidoreductase [Occultella glacieicola]|uniref:NAD(P)-dependent oxidoreductase n=2 Tax=Occultella glacieicola TaxID=2518684 RepID=A0ABY2EAB6_9MICO|nr:NAD(P)-dependent oxidoreductase [Occultella glacieicola]
MNPPPSSPITTATPPTSAANTSTTSDSPARPRVSILGLGVMGAALAGALLAAGYPTTVWNRTPGRAEPLRRSGAAEAASPTEAVTTADLVIVCVFDHASVHDVLDPLVEHLDGIDLINLTTTTPEEARELAAWSSTRGINYLDGGIMAVPAMIGQDGSSILYSGAAEVFQRHERLLGSWGEATYFGGDAGLASLEDLALLSGMYVMFAGLLHGMAMVASVGVSASTFVTRAQPFLAAMTETFPAFAETIDSRRYDAPDRQSLEFSDLGNLVRASTEAGISPAVVQMVQDLIMRQRDAGFGDEDFSRIYESIAHPVTTESSAS